MFSLFLSGGGSGLLTLDEQGEITGDLYVTSRAIAKVFDISMRWVQQLTKEGVIQAIEMPGEGRRYNFLPTVEAYARYQSKKIKGREKPEKEVKLRQQKLEAEIALKESQGELHRMKCEIAAGTYIDIAEVVLDYQKFFTTFKRFAMGIPSRLLGLISDKLDPLESRRIEKEMGLEVTRMLRAFTVAGQKPEKAKRKKKGQKDAGVETVSHAEV